MWAPSFVYFDSGPREGYSEIFWFLQQTALKPPLLFNMSVYINEMLGVMCAMSLRKPIRVSRRPRKGLSCPLDPSLSWLESTAYGHTVMQHARHFRSNAPSGRSVCPTRFCESCVSWIFHFETSYDCHYTEMGIGRADRSRRWML